MAPDLAACAFHLQRARFDDEAKMQLENRDSVTKTSPTHGQAKVDSGNLSGTFYFDSFTAESMGYFCGAEEAPHHASN